MLAGTSIEDNQPKVKRACVLGVTLAQEPEGPAVDLEDLAVEEIVKTALASRMSLTSGVIEYC